MAVISITIPDAQLNRVVNAICLQHSYQALLMDGSPNPETKAQYARRMVAMTVKNWVKTIEGNSAAELARIAAVNDADTIAIT